MCRARLHGRRLGRSIGDGPTNASPALDEGRERGAPLAGCDGRSPLRTGNGFFTRPGPGPAGHFRTSAHTGPTFARAIAALIADVDAALGHPTGWTSSTWAPAVASC